MGCPIVNALFAHNSVATTSSSLLRQSWNSAPSDGVRRPGTTPVSQALPWALAWSTILCCPPPTGSPSLYSRAGRLLRRGDTAPERRTTCPSSDRATFDQDGSCSKDRRVCRSPWTTLWEGPTTRGLSPPRLNSAARLQLTVPCSLLSLIRLAFRRGGSSHCYSTASVYRGLPTLRQATCRTLW